jgi:inosose dehydratase
MPERWTTWAALTARHAVSTVAVEVADPTNPDTGSATSTDATGNPDGGRSWLEAVSGVGAQVVVISAGAAEGDAQRQRRVAELGLLADVLGESGFTLALDTAEGLCGDARGMLRTLQEVDRANVRIALDTGRYLALNPEANAEIAVQRVAPHLGLIRLTDSTGIWKDDSFPALGCGGAVDFARLLQILDGVGFDGPCLIDFRPRSGRGFSLDQAQAWLAESVELLGDCGWFDQRI